MTSTGGAPGGHISYPRSVPHQHLRGVGRPEGTAAEAGADRQGLCPGQCWAPKKHPPAGQPAPPGGFPATLCCPFGTAVPEEVLSLSLLAATGTQGTGGRVQRTRVGALAVGLRRGLFQPQSLPRPPPRLSEPQFPPCERGSETLLAEVTLGCTAACVSRSLSLMVRKEGRSHF